MQENNNSHIRAILEEIEREKAEKRKAEATGEVEFEIGKKKETTPKAEEKPAEKAAPAAEEPPREEPKEEAAPPSIFDIAEAEDSKAAITDEVLKIDTVYMPSFTEVSELFYKYGRIPTGEELGIKSEEEKAPLSEEEKIDAIAELPDTDYGAKLVDLSEKRLTPEDSVSTVFKFEDDTPEEEVKAEEEEEAPVVLPETKEEEPMPAAEKAEEPEAEEKKPEPLPEPSPKPLPEKYVPTAVSAREVIPEIGDELAEENRREFNSRSKRDFFKDRFLDSLMSQRVRFFVALAISLALLVFESLGMFGLDLISLFKFNANPQALAIIDLQCTSCVVLLALPEILRALRSAFKRSFSSDLFVLAAYLAYVIYSVIIIANAPSSYPLIGAIPSIFALVLIASAYFRASADFEAFKMVSGAEDKFIVDNKFTRTLERENMALDGLVEEYKSRTARVFRTSFVADFFRRCARGTEELKHILLLVLPSFGAALVTALISFFLWDGIVSAVSSFAVVFMLSLPAFSLLVHKLPHLHATLAAKGDGGTLIGEVSFFDYSGVDVICLNDTDIFGAEDVNIQRIMLYGNPENLTRALRQMSALFKNVGGPLDEIFSASLEIPVAAANGVYIKEDGLIGELDGKKVMAGGYDFMLSEGVTIPEDDENTKKSFDATKVIYAAEGGEVYAKFYIRYRFSEEFTMLMPTLKEEGIIPLVYTRDPNLTNSLLKTLTAGLGTIRILKKNTTPMRDFAPSKISAGMVTDGDKSNLLSLILLAKRYAKFNTQMKITERYAMISGLVLGVVLSLCNMSVALPPLVIALWHAAWCVVLSVISRKFFKVSKKKKDKR